MESSLVGKENGEVKNFFSVIFLLQCLTCCLDAGKAIWNRYFQLLLLESGFSVAEVGIIKSSSLVAKAFLQLIIPTLEDSGIFQNYLPPNLSSHILVVVASILSIPIFLATESFCQPKGFYVLIFLKGLISFLGVFVGLADGIVARTIQIENLSYSRQQSFHAVAWCAALLFGGYLVDVFGFPIIFPIVAVSKGLVGGIVIFLGRLRPLPRESSSSPFSALKRGALEIWENVGLCKILVFFSLWGSCFVVIEGLTFIQMDRDFGLSKFSMGVSAVISLAGGLIVYRNAKRLLFVLGHQNLISLGIFTSTIFLLAQSFLTKERGMLSLPLCLLRGFSYAAIWASCMDVVVTEVRNELLTSVQALITFSWFTVGQGWGLVFWMRFYDEYGPSHAYALCSGLLVVSGVVFRKTPQNLRAPRRLFTKILLIFAVGIVFLVWGGVGIHSRLSDRKWTRWVESRSNFSDARSNLQNPVLNMSRHQLVTSSVPGMAPLLNMSRHLPATFSGTAALSKDVLATRTMDMLKTLQEHSGNASASMRRVPETIHEYVRYRRDHQNPKLYSHWADRLWLNQWDKARRCNASVPKLLAFFSPMNISGLRDFVAPAEGAVVKLNHHAGGVTILKAFSSLTEERLLFYGKMINEKYPSPIEPHYKFVPHGVIIEKFLSALAGGKERPPDFKAYAFDGNISLVRVDLERKCSGQECKASSLFLEPREFRRLPFSHHHFRDFVGSFEKPCGWDSAMRTVECLSFGINFARIDVYLVNCECFLGEMTMTPMGGHQENSMAAQKYMAGFLKSWEIYPRELASALF